MKIAILGSTGFLGKVLLEKALNAGYQVRTLVRTPAKLGQFRDENENWTVGRRLLRLMLQLVWKPGFVAKQLEWEVLKGSNLDWTLVRPPHIVNGEPAGKVSADEKNLSKTNVNVEDLADFMLAQIDSKEWIRRAPWWAPRGSYQHAS